MLSKKVTPEIRRAGIKTIEQDISKRAGIKQSSRSQADEHDQSRRAGTKKISRNQIRRAGTEADEQETKKHTGRNHIRRAAIKTERADG
jgi:hypothetical protein